MRRDLCYPEKISKLPLTSACSWKKLICEKVLCSSNQVPLFSVNDLAYLDRWCFIASFCYVYGHSTKELCRHSAGWLPLAVSTWQRLYQRAISCNVSTSLLNWLILTCLSSGSINLMQKPWCFCTAGWDWSSLGDASVCGVACCYS